MREDVAIEVENAEVRAAVVRKEGVIGRGGQGTRRAFVWKGEGEGGEERSLRDVLAVGEGGG